MQVQRPALGGTSGKIYTPLQLASAHELSSGSRQTNRRLLCDAVIWFVYMLIYGVLPQNLSEGVYHLFQEVMATSATFWLLIIMAPVACVLPGYLWRQIRS